MKTKRKRPESSAQELMEFARPLAPEDIAVGDCVVVSDSTYEFPSFYWCGSELNDFGGEPLVRLTYQNTMPKPLKVKAICFPYVLCTTLKGRRRLIDLRRNELRRLSKRFVKAYRRWGGKSAAEKSGKANGKSKRKSK
ncbi:MAG: hypothetical protein AB8B50_08705 [Pirellulaceae bacterium]